MPYLNWIETPIVFCSSVESLKMTQLSLTLKSVELEALVSNLEEVYFSSGEELRLSLSIDWTLFWKVREGSESRALLAHPNVQEWVGTLALQSHEAKSLVLSLKKMELGQSLRIGDRVKLASVSNLEIEINRSPKE